MAGANHPKVIAANRQREEANHELRLKAYYMRLSGWTYEQIGDELDRGPTTIHRWVRKHMDKAEREAVEKIRQLDLARLDKMLVAIDHILMTGTPAQKLKAAPELIRIQQARQKLVPGLAAAEKVEVEVTEKTDAEKRLDDMLKRADQKFRQEEQDMKAQDDATPEP